MSVRAVLRAIGDFSHAHNDADKMLWTEFLRRVDYVGVILA